MKVICFLVIYCFLVGCKNSGAKKGQNVKAKENEKTLKSKGYSGNGLKFAPMDSVMNLNGQLVPVDAIIDFSTFKAFNELEHYNELVRNEYYLVNPVDNYFIDSTFVYVYSYLESEPPLFFIAGNSDDYKVLGGAYLKVADKVFWRGVKLENVTVDDFTSFNAGRKNSEWDATLGLDGRHIYEGNRIAKQKELKERYFVSDALIKRYFDN